MRGLKSILLNSGSSNMDLAVKLLEYTLEVPGKLSGAWGKPWFWIAPGVKFAWTWRVSLKSRIAMRIMYIYIHIYIYTCFSEFVRISFFIIISEDAAFSKSSFATYPRRVLP